MLNLNGFNKTSDSKLITENKVLIFIGWSLLTVTIVVITVLKDFSRFVLANCNRTRAHKGANISFAGGGIFRVCFRLRRDFISLFTFETKRTQLKT